MCGIAGVFGVSDCTSVEKMLKAMSHRGPDDRGLWDDANIPATLGHQRLSILDLSANGHQPMPYANERYWVVYNGELYNYHALRTTLMQHGCVFHSQCDTEIIPAAYATWGTGMLSHLRGMFAFALIDRHAENNQPSLFLARDRMGIKPLLVARKGKALWFASEMRALRASGAMDNAINTEAFYDYCIFGSVLQPRTILQNVNTLPAGHYLTRTSSGEEHTTRYWDIHTSTASLRRLLTNISEEDATRQLREHLKTATKGHLLADVPVGAFLSGGLDSASVVALMQEQSPHKVKTFSLGFDGPLTDKDERIRARDTARQLGTDHHEIVVSGNDVAERFDRIVGDMDQPTIDGTNTWLISQAAAREVKVVISGLGGDELFAGYRHFELLRQADRHAPEGNRLAYRFWHCVRRRFRTGHAAYYRMIAAAPLMVRRALVRRIMQNRQITQTFRPEVQAHIFARVDAAYAHWYAEGADSIQTTSYAEVNGYLLNTLLRDSDVTSMAHSLELRPILLDHELAEWAYALPGHLKLNGSKKKYILTKSMEHLLSPEILSRPKQGFELPMMQWMTRALKDRILNLLDDPNAHHLFTQAYLNRTSINLRAGKASPELWAWLVLLQWLRQTKTTL